MHPVLKFRKTFLAAIAFVVLIVAVFILTKPKPLPLVILPSPNGYDDLVKGGEMIVGQEIDCNFDNSECIEEWKAFFEKNNEALKLVRIGLSRESRVPMQFTNSSLANHGLAALKLLAQTLQAEGNVAQKENRLDDAITSYLDVVRLSQKIRGGVMIDALVSLAIEPIGLQPLQKASDKMTVDQRRRAIKTLSEVYSDRASFNEIVTMEKAYARNAYTLSEKFSSLRYYFSMKDAERRLETKIKYRQCRMGVMLVDLAVRNYEAGKSQLPTALAELVPEYLPFLPKDDFSGKDFIYHPQTNGYLLYGIGPDGKDDGGTPFSKKGGDSPGDMLNDAHY